MPKITRLPDGTYETRISVIDPRTGKRHQPRVRARSKRDLERQIAEARVTIQRGEYIEPDRTSLGDWLDVWLPTYHPPAESTVRLRRIAIERIKSDEITDIRLSRLASRDIQRFVDRLMGELEPISIQPILTVLSMALDHAVDVAEIIPRSPMRGIKPPAAKPRSMNVWDRPQVAAFLDALEDHEHAAAWKLAVMLGVRIGELVALRWDDIDLDVGRVTIRRTLSRDAAGVAYIRDWTKSPAGRRSLILPDNCREEFKRLRDLTDDRRRDMGDIWSADNAVFDNGTGGFYLSDSYLRYGFDRVCASVPRLPRIRPHDLRHTAATAMLRAHVPIQTVSRILGHSSPAVTLRVYAWVLDSMEEEAAATIGSMYE